MLSSGTLQDRLIRQFSLARVYKRRRPEDLRKKLAENTNISQDIKSGVVTVVVSDTNPQRAALMASAYGEELNRMVSDLSTASAHRERVFIKTVKQDLDTAAVELSHFSSRNATLDVQNQGRTMVDSAAKLEGEIIVARSELRGLEAIYSDQNTRVRAVQARLSELERQLQKMSGTGRDLNTADLTNGELYPPLRKLPLLGVTYYDLYRRVKTQEAVFELLTKQYEMAKVEEAKEIPTIGILEAPIVPQKRAGPPRIAIATLGFLLSLGFGVLWVIGHDRWEDLGPEHKLLVNNMLKDLRPRRLRPAN
jgi:capsule polysaccharide export protein KpsE/RkpR